MDVIVSFGLLLECLGERCMSVHAKKFIHFGMFANDIQLPRDVRMASFGVKRCATSSGDSIRHSVVSMGRCNDKSFCLDRLLVWHTFPTM